MAARDGAARRAAQARVWSYVVFGAYLLFLVWLVLFKFAVRIEDVPRMRSLNLIPFRYGTETSFHGREVLYNVLAFLPAGFYLTAFHERKGLLLGTAAAALLSLSFETAQWVLAIGASDVTDLIANTAGALLGMLAYLALGRLAGSRRMMIADLLGSVALLVAVVLLIVLLGANRA